MDIIYLLHIKFWS